MTVQKDPQRPLPEVPAAILMRGALWLSSLHSTPVGPPKQEHKGLNKIRIVVDTVLISLSSVHEPLMIINRAMPEL